MALASHRLFHLAAISLYLALLLSLAHADQLLPFYNDGNFTFPAQVKDDKDGNTFPIYDLGTSMTIRWKTTYESVNLFYVQFGDDADSKQIALGVIGTSFQWNPIQVDLTNLSIPFHFHCVDPTNADQTSTGFWSSGFFLRDRQNLAASSASPSPSPSRAFSSASPSLSSTPFSSSAPSSSASVATQSGFTTSQAPSISIFTSIISSTPTSASSGATSAADPRPGLSGGVIAGIAVGALAGGSLLAGLVFLLCLRKKNKHTVELDATHGLYNPNGQYINIIAENPPVEMATLEKVNEVPAWRERAELPGWGYDKQGRRSRSSDINARGSIRSSNRLGNGEPI